MSGNPDWLKTAVIHGASAEGPVRKLLGDGGSAGKEYVDIDFVPALRRIMGEEPGSAIQSDLKTVLKLLAGLRMDMLKAALIHLAISETYRDVLEAEIGDEITVIPGNKSKARDVGEPT